MSLRQPLLLVLTCLTGASLLPAQSGDEVRPALELAYARWRSAVEARDAKDWASAITMHRQVITRNMVISQGLAFPKSVFETMLAPAETRGLRLLEAQAVGDPTGAEMVRAGLAQRPRHQSRSHPQQRQRTQSRLRERGAGQRAQHQQGGAVGNDVFHGAVQQRSGQHPQQAFP